MTKCFKCGIEGGILQKRNRNIMPAIIIVHHISYNPEIIVDCCRSCHTKIHKHIRKDNKCLLSSREINRLSCNSSAKRIRKTIQFYELIAPHIYLREDIWFTKTTGNIVVSSFFIANNKKELLIIEEEI